MRACAAPHVVGRELPLLRAQVCRHMVYIPVLRKVLAIVKSNNARLLTTGRGCRVERSLEVPGSILSADYNRMTETLTFATAENRFLVYKCSYISGTARLGELCLRRQMDLKSAQTVVRWGPQADRLYSGTKTGDVLAWRFYSQPRGLGVAKDLDLEVYRRWPGIHSDAVKDVLVLPGETRIVTCSLDTNVMELVRPPRRSPPASPVFWGCVRKAPPPPAPSRTQVGECQPAHLFIGERLPRNEPQLAVPRRFPSVGR